MFSMIAQATLRGESRCPSISGAVRFSPLCAGSMVQIQARGLPRGREGTFFSLVVILCSGARIELPPLLACGGEAIMTVYAAAFSPTEAIGGRVEIYDCQCGERLACGEIVCCDARPPCPDYGITPCPPPHQSCPDYGRPPCPPPHQSCPDYGRPPCPPLYPPCPDRPRPPLCPPSPWPPCRPTPNCPSRIRYY